MTAINGTMQEMPAITSAVHRDAVQKVSRSLSGMGVKKVPVSPSDGQYQLRGNLSCEERAAIPYPERVDLLLQLGGTRFRVKVVGTKNEEFSSCALRVYTYRGDDITARLYPLLIVLVGGTRQSFTHGMQPMLNALEADGGAVLTQTELRSFIRKHTGGHRDA